MGARWRTTTGTGRAGIRIAAAGAATTTLFTLWIRTRKQSMRRRRVRKLESARAACAQLHPAPAKVEILRRSSTTAYIGFCSSEVGHSKRSRSCSCAHAGQGTRLTASTRRGRVPSCGRTFVRFHLGLRTLVRGPERRSGAQPRSWDSGKCRRTSLGNRVGSLLNTNVYIRRLFSSETGSLFTLLKHGENSQGQLGKNE